MIANLTEYFWAPEFVQKYLNMILHHILKSWQIGSGQKKDISDLAKMLFETYVPAASTLNIHLSKFHFWFETHKNKIEYIWP